MSKIIDDYLLSSYDYELPKELIAQSPKQPRHSARLMVVREALKDSSIDSGLTVWDFQQEIQPGDLLVLNDTKVIKARLNIRLPNEKIAELFLLEPLDNGKWLCLGRPAKRMQPGDIVFLEALNEPPIQLKIVGRDKKSGARIVEFPAQYKSREAIYDLLQKFGEVPLPPYIKSHDQADEERYQTCYAVNPGAVAAPTAGLHFSPELLHVLDQKGVNQVKVTLHIGLGTFRPLDVEDLTDLQLHSEWVEVREEVVRAVNDCRKKGGRVFAVGTTSVRALEGAFSVSEHGLKPFRGPVDLVIKPGYKFGVVDGLLTNFHLPKSSLLLLVSAFIGRRRLLTLYSRAISSKYRFFSYGDAMLITPDSVLPSSRL